MMDKEREFGSLRDSGCIPRRFHADKEGGLLQLRRIMSSGTWIPQIDGLRFVAIVSVVLYHLLGQLVARTGHLVAIQARYGLLVRMIDNGDRGVLLFFVISGFILARPFLRQHRLGGKPVLLRHYFLRRLTRLEPPYILCLLAYTVAFWAYGAPLRLMLPHLAASMLYLHGLIYRTQSPINFVTWSLEIEVQFYILAPLLGLFFLVQSSVVRRLALLTAILAAGGCSLWANSHLDTIWRETIFNCLHYFLAGFLLADLVEGHQQQPFRSVWWDVVSLGAWPIVFLLPRNLATLAWLPLLILPLYLAAFYGPASNWFFRRPFVALAGGMCYSIYLMHMLIVSVVFKATRHLVIFNDLLMNYSVQILLLGSAIALFGGLYYVFVERPCMEPQWPQKLWRSVFRAKKVHVTHTIAH